MTEKDKELLKDEYIVLQQTIDSFDTKSLTIKTWGVSVSMAGIGGAFVSDIPILLLVVSFGSIMFLYIEYLWKRFQINHFARVIEIEKHFRTGCDIVLFQTSKSWENEDAKKYFVDKEGNSHPKTLKILSWPNVSLFWISIFLISLILFWMQY